MKQELQNEDLSSAEVYLAFSDAMRANMSDQKKAAAAAAIEELERVRKPQPKTIFETVHGIMFSE